MHRTNRRLPLLVLAAAPLAVAAAQGAFEINQDCAAVGCFPGDSAGFPVVITQPGTYVLTSDLGPPGNVLSNAISVLVGDVDIDLNGHTIDGGGACSQTPVINCAGASGYAGIQFSNSGSPGVWHVHDGTIRGFLSGGGIAMTDAGDGTVIERLSVLENAATVALSVDGNTGNAAVRLRSLQVARNGGYGIGYSSVPPRFIVQDSTIAGNKFAGASFNGGAVLLDDHFVDNGQVGVNCSGVCALGRNTFQANNGGGANAQWAITTLRDMGHNVCLDDGTCP